MTFFNLLDNKYSKIELNKELLVAALIHELKQQLCDQSFF